MLSTPANNPLTLTIEAGADILASADIIASTDSGGSVTHEINHPEHGHAFLTSSIADHCTLIRA